MVKSRQSAEKWPKNVNENDENNERESVKKMRRNHEPATPPDGSSIYPQVRMVSTNTGNMYGACTLQAGFFTCA